MTGPDQGKRALLCWGTDEVVGDGAVGLQQSEARLFTIWAREEEVDGVESGGSCEGRCASRSVSVWEEQLLATGTQNTRDPGKASATWTGTRTRTRDMDINWLGT